MVNAKRLTVLLLTAILTASSAAAPAMAAGIPAEETMEVNEATNSETVSESETAPKESEECPLQETLPVEEKNTAEEETLPAEEEVLTENQTTPAEEEVLTENQTTSEEEEILTENQTTPAEEEIPTENQTTPEEEETSVKAAGESVSGDPVVDIELPENTDFSTAKQITLDVEETIPYTGSNNDIYYKFTPEETGPYYLYSKTAGYVSLKGMLYDESHMEIKELVLEGPLETGYGTAVVLEGGNTYYIELSNDTKDVDCKFGIKRESFYAIQEDSSVYVDFGQEVRLRVNVWADSPIEYTWMDRLGNVIPDSTSEELVFKANKSGNYEYNCKVKAGSNEESLTFVVHVYNEVYAEAGPTFFYVSYGDEVTLEVKEGAYALDQSEISYHWYDRNTEELIEGETERTLNLVANKSYYYRCEVEAEDGTYESFDYTVFFDNGLVVYPEGSRVNQDGTRRNFSTYKKDEAGKVTLKVIVEAKDTEGLEYAWYGDYSVYGEGGTEPIWEPGSQYALIKGSNSDTLELTDPESESFKCVVTDRFGNRESVYFYKEWSSGGEQLIAYPEGAEEDSEGNKKNEINLKVKKSDTVTMKVITEPEDENLVFEWYMSESYNSVELPEDAEVQGNTAVIHNPKTTTYTCNVYRKGEESYTGSYVYFNVEVENNLFAYPEINGETNAAKEDTVRIAATASGKVSLKVIADADDTDQMEYTWSRSDTLYYIWREVEENKDKKEITVDQNGSTAAYMCEIKDQYGNTKPVYFEIIKNNTRVGSENREVDHRYRANYYVNVKKVRGADITLKTTVTGEDTSKVKYKWRWEFGSHYYSNISDTDSYVVKSDLPGQVYECYVNDGYDNYYYVYYKVQIVDQCEKHEYGDWIVTKAPTATEAGSRKKICSICGNEITEVINPLTGSWKKDKQGWWYQWSDGTYPRNDFEEIDGKTYYFNASGYMVTGWKSVNATWYYFDGSGAMKTGWLKLGSTWYFLDGSGAMQTGLQTIVGAKYYFNGSGAMQTGWQKIGGMWYYFAGSGAMKTGWLKLGRTWYYLSGNGAMQTGWQNIDNTWYYFDGSGAMKTGWQKLGSTWYYLNGSGAMKTGWLKLGSTWYCFNGSGAMQTGLQTIGSAKYYFAGSGAMKTGWQKISGAWYYFDGSGAMVTNKWVGNYYLAGDGKMAVNQWIGSYYVGADGKWIPGYKK